MPSPTVTVDALAVANGGHSGRWNHLLFYPHDGTFIRGYPSGAVYRVIRGAPQRVTSWSRYGGPQPTTLVPQVSIDRGGTGAPYDHLR